MFIKYYQYYQNSYIDKKGKKMYFTYYHLVCVNIYIYIYLFLYIFMYIFIFIKLFSQTFPIKDTLKIFSTNCFL